MEQMEPIARTNVHERIVQAFVDMICDGRLPVGKKLCPEIQLAGELQVSRNMLREAMKTLEVLGIVEITHGRGTYISPHALQQLANMDFVRSLACNQTVSELLETRVVLEPGLAEFAALRHTPEDVERLWESVTEMVRQHPENRAAGSSFHLAVARASGCGVLAKYLESVIRQLEFSDYGRLQSTMTQKHLAQEAADHQRIVERIIEGDGKGAKNLMYQHLSKRYQMLQALQPSK